MTFLGGAAWPKAKLETHNTPSRQARLAGTTRGTDRKYKGDVRPADGVCVRGQVAWLSGSES